MTGRRPCYRQKKEMVRRQQRDYTKMDSASTTKIAENGHRRKDIVAKLPHVPKSNLQGYGKPPTQTFKTRHSNIFLSIFYLKLYNKIKLKQTWAFYTGDLYCQITQAKIRRTIKNHNRNTAMKQSVIYYSGRWGCVGDLTSFTGSSPCS